MKKGFTLIQLIVVIASIGLILIFLTFALNKADDKNAYDEKFKQECVKNGNIYDKKDRSCNIGQEGKDRQLQFDLLVLPLKKECEEILMGKFFSVSAWSEKSISHALLDVGCFKETQKEEKTWVINNNLKWQLLKTIVRNKVNQNYIGD